MTKPEPREVVALLRRAHKMSVSGPHVPDDATTYGMGAVALERALLDLEAAREELRDKRTDDRRESEKRSWARLVPESVLYPDHFLLMGTSTGAGMRGRLADGRIYHRNHDGLLQPVPGEVWLHESTNLTYLVLATAEYRNHAVIDVMRYTGPIPTAPEENES